jgi:hypothetical protein
MTGPRRKGDSGWTVTATGSNQNSTGLRPAGSGVGSTPRSASATGSPVTWRYMALAKIRGAREARDDKKPCDKAAACEDGCPSARRWHLRVSGGAEPADIPLPASARKVDGALLQGRDEKR